MAINSMRRRIERWLENKPDWFNYAELDSDINIQTAKDKTLRRVVICTLVNDWALVKHEYRRNTYRRTGARKVSLLER